MLNPHIAISGASSIQGAAKDASLAVVQETLFLA
jgi:hypothetical protein